MFDIPVSNAVLEQRVEERTAALSQALALVEAQKLELERVLRRQGETQRQLEAELEDAHLLHGISAMLIGENTIGDLYRRLVEAATLIMRSDFGSMQRHDDERGELQLIAHRGLDDEAVAFWQWVHPGRATTCGRALDVHERVIVPDFEACHFIAGSADLAAFRRAGVRSAQSTPLVTRDGRLVGMISTHWTRCHEPEERELRLLDIVARQAADLIERNRSADALRHQAERLLDADRHKDEFLATLAHELRNPLAPIRTGLSLLTIGKPEQVARVVPVMERQLGHMVRLVDDLLDVSRISRGLITLRRSRVELRAVVDSAIETSQPLINAASHRFTVTVPGTPVWLDADVTRIVQVISNLLNNAARYTPKGGHIQLVAETAGGEAVVRVVDTGIGIPAEMLPRIFDLFTQVDRSTERSQGGLGVGLALAKQLAVMHGGRIEVERSNPREGSVFALRLPVAAAGGREASADPAQAHVDERRSRVLIVDDNVDAAETFALLLEELGHATRVVFESPQALAAALEFAPDIVFLDIGMPHLDGFGLARQLRGHPALRQVRLAALSGWGTDDDRAKSRAAGIDHHLAKPVVMQEVADILATVRAV